jgi:hypothetical protein
MARSSWAIAALMTLAAPSHAQEPQTRPHPDCVAENQTVSLFSKDGQTLTFVRFQCPAAVSPDMSFEIKNGDTLVARWNVGRPVEAEVAKFWPLDGARPSVRIRELAESETSPGERARCEVILDFATGQYSWTPNAAYLEDLLGANEPFSACGTYGDSNDSVQFWQVIDGKLLAYVRAGQETPMFDPASFQFKDGN